MKKYTKIRQARDIIISEQKIKRYHLIEELGQEAGETAPLGTVTYHGTPKCHGSNFGLHVVVGDTLGDYTISPQSRTKTLGGAGGHFGAVERINSEPFKSTFERCLTMFCIANPDVKNFTVFGEWAGCFSFYTPILLADGTTKTIGTIVKNKLKVEVMTYNLETEKLEPKPVIDWFKNGSTDEWLELIYTPRRRGGRGTKVVVTPNHTIFTERNGSMEEVAVKDLEVGDTVYTTGNNLSLNQLDFIRGSILGDGSFSYKKHFVVGHSDDNQPAYNDFIETLFEGVSNTCKVVSGHGSDMRRVTTNSFAQIEDIYNVLNVDGRKSVTTEYLNLLNPKSLAVWYMDDGNIIKHSSGGRIDRACLNTQGFTYEENQLISEWFKSRGYENNVIKHFKYDKPLYSIHFNVSGSTRLFSDIAPYVLEHFNYKIPVRFHKIQKHDWFESLNDYEDNIIKTTIRSIKSFTPSEEHLKVKYDIQVEGNSNYFANRMLVHNSGVQKKVGVCRFDKFFYVFDVYDHDKEVYVQNASHFFWSDDSSIINKMQMIYYSVVVDLDDPQPALDRMNKLTEDVEHRCPIAFYLYEQKHGKPPEDDVELIGEGIVWERFKADGTRMSFKTKGDKHSCKGSGRKAQLDPIVTKSINEFVERVVTEDRLANVYQNIVGDQDPEMWMMGKLMPALYQDILDEEGDAIIHDGDEKTYRVSDIGTHINNAAKGYFIGRLRAI